jgi:hypothetical protein
VTRARDVASQGGLVLISSTTYSGVAGVTIDNCFSSAYKNYKILSNVSLSADNWITLNYRTVGVSPTTDTSSNYSNNNFGSQNFSGWSSNNYNISRSNSILAITTSSFRSDLSLEIEVFSPYETARTTGNHRYRVYNTGTSAMGLYVGGHGNKSTTSFGGIYFATNSGTITGNIAVYGYK